MQAAKEAVKNLMHRSRSRSSERKGRHVETKDTIDRTSLDRTERERLGRHDRERVDTRTGIEGRPHGNAHIDSAIVRERKAETEIHEIVKPAITKEIVIEENREQTTTAINRELHQDHYQTRIQPIVDRKVLAEEHVHRSMPVEYKEHKHKNEAEIRRALEEEHSRFKSTREVLPTKHTVETGETIVGEHHHHHVYETIQPVIERKIIQPVVTHTTIPVHERIEKAPTFHPKTIQPVMTMEEFVRAGGAIEGRAERVEVFEGEPAIMENGGADKKHPHRGHHLDTTGDRTTATTTSNTTTTGSTGMGGVATARAAPTTTRLMEGTRRTGSPLTAAERESITQGGTDRNRSPLPSPGLHTAGRQSAI